jgi:hypothetical protein
VVRLDGGRRPTFVYRVPARGLIRISVRQVAPICRVAATFTVRARPGLNHLRFSGRIRGHRLERGTYVVRARRGATTVFRKILIVGDSSPTANVCVSAADSSSGGSSEGRAASGTSDDNAARESAAAADKSAISNPRRSGLLGARASRILPGSGGTQLGLLIVLAAAIFLLGLGALPRELIPHPAAAAFLVQRRTLVAVGGLVTLSVFLVSYFLL